jgi:hypothetical protein
MHINAYDCETAIFLCCIVYMHSVLLVQRHFVLCVYINVVCWMSGNRFGTKPIVQIITGRMVISFRARNPLKYDP